MEKPQVLCPRCNATDSLSLGWGSLQGVANSPPRLMLSCASCAGRWPLDWTAGAVMEIEQGAAILRGSVIARLIDDGLADARVKSNVLAMEQLGVGIARMGVREGAGLFVALREVAGTMAQDTPPEEPNEAVRMVALMYGFQMGHDYAAIHGPLLQGPYPDAAKDQAKLDRLEGAATERGMNTTEFADWLLELYAFALRVRAFSVKKAGLLGAKKAADQFLNEFETLMKVGNMPSHGTEATP